MSVLYSPKRFLLIIVLATGLLSVSFQIPKTSKVEIKNIGLSSDEPAKIMLALEEGDDLRINIRNRGKENELKDTETEFKLWKTGEETILLTGNIGNKTYKYAPPAKGSYVLELMTKRKKEQFCHISLEKVAGAWSSDKPAVTIKSTLLEPPSKGLDNKLRITYPVAPDFNISIAGEGKNAGAITLEIPALDVKTSLDKGFQQKEKLAKDLDVYLYLDEGNLKDKGWLDRIIGKYKKAAYNINKFCEIKVNSPEKRKDNTSEGSIAGKASGPQASSVSSANEKASERNDNKEFKVKDESGEKTNEQILLSALSSISSLPSLLKKDDNQKKLIPLPNPMTLITLDLTSQFDFTVPVKKVKRKCAEIKINDVGSQYYAYWAGISSDIFEGYQRMQDGLKALGHTSTLLNIYSDGMYFQRSIREPAYNTEMQPFPLPLRRMPVIDNVEIAILDADNKIRFEDGRDYESIVSDFYRTTGQMFGFSPIRHIGPIYLCGCNKNKLTPVTIKALFETYAIPETDL